ncbi:MAG: antibiotic biosynthesis monooxygenase family protein [Verrucomicrobiota bacterium]
MKVLLVILLLAGVGIAWASVGHVGYSFRGPGYDPNSGVTTKLEGPVIIALTDGKIKRGSGAAFFKELRQVLDAIPESEGLIGYAVRKELLGNKVWTLSAWTSRDALKRFVSSESHRQAVKAGGISPATVHSVTLEMSPSELPISWKRVENILEDAES